jgi:hypothetical protein
LLSAVNHAGLTPLIFNVYQAQKMPKNPMIVAIPKVISDWDSIPATSLGSPDAYSPSGPKTKIAV